MGVGLYLVRWRRRKANLPRGEFQAWHVAVLFNIIVQIFTLVMPWWPPAAGKADVSFWYATYVVTGILM